MNEPMQLSLEQQFSLKSFETQVGQMSREQCQDFLKKFYEQQMLRENHWKTLLRHSWNIEPAVSFPPKE